MPYSRYRLDIDLIEHHDPHRALDQHTHAGPDHQSGQPLAVDQYYTCSDLVREALGILAESARRNKDALVCTVSRQCTNKFLNRGAPDGVRLGVTLSLHVDAGESECILVDDARSEEHTSELQSRGHLVCR